MWNKAKHSIDIRNICWVPFLYSMDLGFLKTPVFCMYHLLHVYGQRSPKIPSSQWHLMFEKLLCMSFNTLGRWSKDYFPSFICLERMLMIRCQFSLHFFLNCLANWYLNKEHLLLLLFLYILLNLGKCAT